MRSKKLRNMKDNRDMFLTNWCSIIYIDRLNSGVCFSLSVRREVISRLVGQYVLRLCIINSKTCLQLE